MSIQLSNVGKKMGQHRAFYCYLLLSTWLILLLLVMYKYLETEDVTLTIMKSTGSDETTRSFSVNLHADIKSQRVLRTCNLPHNIKVISEGYVKDSFQLEGVIILFRHGDRGPLTHVRNIENIDCATTSVSLKGYEAYLDNMTGTSQLAQILGAFHGFPLLPQQYCSLGQLTRVGISQLLTLGETLRTVYAEKLKLMNLTTPDDIIVYSTKYRRTFQSALAFLYGFLTSDLMHNVVFRETPSLQFCFDDCACPSGDMYLKRFEREKSNHLTLHPGVLKLIKSASLIVYEVYEKHQIRDPFSLRDALLAYVCHGAQLPCLNKRISPPVCVHTVQVTGLLTYIEWEARQNSQSENLKKACLLRAYGMIRNIVSYLLRMISEKKPKFVLYSGHDKTILYLATALGIVTVDTYLADYASRFVIEVYRNISKGADNIDDTAGNGYFIRLLFNGKDMTNRVQFCKGAVIRNKGPQALFMCPIQTVIQFLHNDYFVSFNASNFKDACMLHFN